MLSAIVYRKLLEYGQKTVNRAKAKLKRKPLSSNSDLVKSVAFKVSQNATIEFEFNDYGENVDRGRRRGAKPPPIKAIKDWAENRGINPYALAKSISKKGIKPYRWIYTSFPDDRFPNSRASRELEALYEELIVLQIEQDLDSLEEQIFWLRQ